MPKDRVARRDFVRTGAAAGLAATVVASTSSASEAEEAVAQVDQAAADQGTLANGMPYGTIGRLKISRLIFGTNTSRQEQNDGKQNHEVLRMILCPMIFFSGPGGPHDACAVVDPIQNAVGSRNSRSKCLLLVCLGFLTREPSLPSCSIFVWVASQNGGVLPAEASLFPVQSRVKTARMPYGREASAGGP
jgi:hypothetical protein